MMDLKLPYFLFFGLGVSFAATHYHSKDVKLTVVKEHSCYLNDIDSLYPTNCTGIEDGQLTVAHQGYCLTNSNDDISLVLTCDRGHWSATNHSVGGRLQREKKSLVFVGLIIACALFCRSGGVITKYPPSFPDPCTPVGIQINYNVNAGENGAVVNWKEPVAADRDGGTASVTQVAGGVNGGRFEGATYGRTHYITYKATDSDGLTGHCHFSFTVTILTCTVLLWPDNGARTCDKSNILGSSCFYKCDDGYQLSGSDTVTCENNPSPTWSPLPTCEKIKCTPPSHPINGSVQCSDMTYKSICTVHCTEGYTLMGSPYMQCQADETWSNDGISMCKDNTPPTITCITPQIFYADRAVTSTSVNWREPTAVDNTDPQPTIVIVDGPSMGAVIEVGSATVKYKAVDSDGNESPECFIELRVEEITCSHPFDIFNDNYLGFRCTMPRYTYGVSCNLSCLANLPLNGTELITCEDNGNSKGVWNWGTGEKPFCREIACPELDPPINGALVYDTILTRPVYTMLCNNKYDIPVMSSNFNGMFFCKDNGGWTPYAVVPDCIEPINPRILNLPAEIFYYGGDCGTEETMAQIEEHFQVIIEDYLKPYLESICPTGETCTADNIVIKCGPIQIRKKRAHLLKYGDFRQQKKYFIENRREHVIQKRQTETHLLILKFDIKVVLNLNNSTLKDEIDKYDDIQLHILKPAVQELVNNGTFDADGFELKNDSFQTTDYGEVKCDAGYKLGGTKCKPCPLGYSRNETSCERCPIGQYKDIESDSSCSICPDGFSTRKTGSKARNDCTKLCAPGSYSADTVESCSPCLQGYYQDKYGQTSCKVCPAGTTTESKNSLSFNDCRSYDVLLENTNGDVTVSTIPAIMDSITFMFWSKRFDGQQSHTELRLINKGADLINVYLTENIRVEIPSQMNETVGLHSSTSWNHVIVTWDTKISRVIVYIGGELVYIKEAVTAPNIPFLENGTFVVTSRGPTGVFLTGLHLLPKVLPERDIQHHLVSCYVSENYDVINMKAFSDIEDQGISIMAPSKCDAIDECLSSPCNSHTCINEQNNFTCMCRDGWSGKSCTVPPDFCISNTCENGATCESGNTSYTCTCSSGFSGAFCEVPPVNGGWSEWSLWPECSQSCGSGTQSRTRACDSPSPDTYGSDCVGNSTETTFCNIEECPVCAKLERRFGTLLNCSTNLSSATTTCVLYCEKNRFLPPGLREFQTYTCGPGTNYAWDSLGNLPSCVGPVGPRYATLTASLEYTTTISDSTKPVVMDAIRANLEATPCNGSPNCQTYVVMKEFRDRPGLTVNATFGIQLQRGPDIQYDAYVSNGIVNDAFQELNDAIWNLESTATYIKNYTIEVFDVTTNDISFTPDPNTLTIEAMVTCDSGYAALNGVCLQCPPGTYSDHGVCNLCAKGTYQENTGQISCSKCPSGRTTRTIGSSDISQCTEGEDRPSSSSALPERTTSGPGQYEKKKTVYIAIAMATLALIAVVAAVGITLWYKRCRPNPIPDEIKSAGDVPGRRNKAMEM